MAADEYFYGATLTAGENSSTVWNPQEKEEEDYPERPNKLIIKQILLGVDAKADEYNVVEVETATKNGTIKIPIAVLKVGENRSSQSFLEFPDGPVTFKLIQGSGPVYIHGHHLIGDPDVGDMDDLEEDGLEDEEDSENEIRAGDDSDEPKSKKQKTSGNNVKAAKNTNNKK